MRVTVIAMWTKGLILSALVVVVAATSANNEAAKAAAQINNLKNALKATAVLPPPVFVSAPAPVVAVAEPAKCEPAPVPSKPKTIVRTIAVAAPPQGFLQCISDLLP